MSDEREALKGKAAGFATYGRKFDKAVETVLAGGVKECRFSPSGRKIFAVVGKAGDEFIDPEKPYCSCSNFFFKVLAGREELCYHLLSYRIASKTGRIDVLEFSDDEYGPYFTASIGDVFEVLAKSS
jgi:predicted nucleic acid-binding Zn finger protein